LSISLFSAERRRREDYLDERQVPVAGRQARLTPIEVEVPKHLVSDAGKVVTRAALSSKLSTD
jgi:DNA-binding response OmpR family regulator